MKREHFVFILMVAAYRILIFLFQIVRQMQMSKPRIHALSSAKRFGGVPDDYIEIHEKMDQTKMVHADVTHRCVFHSAFGAYLIQDIFGISIVNSDGLEVCVRDVAEQHIAEDLGFIPSLTDWLHEMTLQPWMLGSARTDGLDLHTNKKCPTNESKKKN